MVAKGNKGGKATYEGGSEKKYGREGRKSELVH